jgi:hypothetical protein
MRSLQPLQPVEVELTQLCDLVPLRLRDTLYTSCE